MYAPMAFVERSKVDSFRGNIFGFPNAKGVKDQNLGLLDQRLA
jgi:cholinesterase